MSTLMMHTGKRAMEEVSKAKQSLKSGFTPTTQPNPAWWSTHNFQTQFFGH
jgi:hypothetical protein